METFAIPFQTRALEMKTNVCFMKTTAFRPISREGGSGEGRGRGEGVGEARGGIEAFVE